MTDPQYIPQRVRAAISTEGGWDRYCCFQASLRGRDRGPSPLWSGLVLRDKDRSSFALMDPLDIQLVAQEELTQRDPALALTLDDFLVLHKLEDAYRRARQAVQEVFGVRVVSRYATAANQTGLVSIAPVLSDEDLYTSETRGKYVKCQSIWSSLLSPRSLCFLRLDYCTEAGEFGWT